MKVAIIGAGLAPPRRFRAPSMQVADAALAAARLPTEGVCIQSYSDLRWGALPLAKEHASESKPEITGLYPWGGRSPRI